MRTSLDPETAATIAAAFPADNRPGGHILATRQPVHVVYGGAQLFSSKTIAKLGTLARLSFETYAPSAEALTNIFDIAPRIAAAVHERVGEKLASEPVEDYRIDFEDGYGPRSDEDEDGHAAGAARETAAAMAENALPAFFGIRIKPFTPESIERAVRTLDIYVTALVDETSSLPDNFAVTLPKVELPAQVAALTDVLDELESRLGIAHGTIKIELMAETARALVPDDGSLALSRLARAARGRCVAVHFGAYDYTASLGIAGRYQDMLSPACETARGLMQLSLAGSGIRLADGATTLMPVAPHRGEGLTDAQLAENAAAVNAAWRLHFDHCRHSLANGFYQSWDLHPAQLPPRYAAVYSFFLEGLDDAAVRLRNFIDTAARATMVGNLFDDAATGQGLLNFFVRAIDCGALGEGEAAALTRLSVEELRSASFGQIIRARSV